LAVEAYAEAVEAIPLTLAENTDLDLIETMEALRAQHEKPDSKYFGIEVSTDKIKNMLDC